MFPQSHSVPCSCCCSKDTLGGAEAAIWEPFLGSCALGDSFLMGTPSPGLQDALPSFLPSVLSFCPSFSSWILMAGAGILPACCFLLIPSMVHHHGPLCFTGMEPVGWDGACGMVMEPVGWDGGAYGMVMVPVGWDDDGACGMVTEPVGWDDACEMGWNL